MSAVADVEIPVQEDDLLDSLVRGQVRGGTVDLGKEEIETSLRSTSSAGIKEMVLRPRRIAFELFKGRDNQGRDELPPRPRRDRELDIGIVAQAAFDRLGGDILSAGGDDQVLGGR